MREIAFQYPQAAWIAVLACLIFFLQHHLKKDRTKRLHTYTSSKLMSKLIFERSNLIDLMKRIAWVVIWILACLALMGPEGNIRYLPTGQSGKKSSQSQQTHEVIFLVDTSASMSVPDGPHGMTRLEEAKEIMQDIVSQLQGVSLAVYAFTSELTPLVPTTLDYLFTRIMLRELQINEGDVGGTLFVPVLEQLKDKILSDPSAYAHTIILFSDGEDNQVFKSQTPSTDDMQTVLKAMKPLESSQLNFYTVGLGQLKPSIIPKVTTKDGKVVESKLEPILLKKIAEEGKGKYYPANEWNTWELSSTLARLIDQKALQEKNTEGGSRKVIAVSQGEKIVDLYFQIPLGIAILLLLAGLYWPDSSRTNS